jgi:hypothetical protein
MRRSINDFTYAWIILHCVASLVTTSLTPAQTSPPPQHAMPCFTTAPRHFSPKCRFYIFDLMRFYGKAFRSSSLSTRSTIDMQLYWFDTLFWYRHLFISPISLPRHLFYYVSHYYWLPSKLPFRRRYCRRIISIILFHFEHQYHFRPYLLIFHFAAHLSSYRPHALVRTR